MIGGRRKAPLSAEAALLRMADLCARSEQCEGDVMRKLEGFGLGRREAEDVLAELIERKFVDNARFARAYANDKVRFAGWGRRKIAAGLMAKRVSSADVREALQGIDAGEYAEAVDRAARAKARGLDLEDPAERMKLLRHLASRGFEAGVCYGKIEELKRAERDR